MLNSLLVEGIEWDEGNRLKCQKHGVALEEIEAFFRSGTVQTAPDVAHSEEEIRFLAIGTTPQKRPLFVVFTLRDGWIRPISARYMHEKEARKYEKNTSTHH